MAIFQATFLSAGDAIVVNDSKVIAARLSLPIATTLTLRSP